MQSVVLFVDYAFYMKHTSNDKPKKTFIRKVWSFAGSYLLGIVLMSLLLLLTFVGTLYQVEHGPTLGMEGAIDAFFGALYVLIPIGGSNSLISLPLPGMPVTCCLLFINMLIGGVIQARWSWHKAGVLIVHTGSLLLLLSIMLGGRLTQVIEEIPIEEGRIASVEALPFKIRLDQFTPEFYPGTNKPKSFESQLTIIPDQGNSYPSVIRMNEPLRIDGWTFYQMSWKTSIDGQRLVSILRASNNPLDNGPKWASYIISVGLLWHFAWMFIRYMKRRNESPNEKIQRGTQNEEISYAPSWKLVSIILGVLLVFGIGMIAAKPPISYPQVDGYKSWSPDFIEQVDKLAVLDGGRIKPASSYAGFQMLRVLGKRSLTIEADGKKVKLSPTEWMLDCMFRPGYASKYPIFLINRDEVLTQLGLPDTGEKRKKLSFEQLKPHWSTMEEQASRLSRKSSDQLSPVEQDIISLNQNAQLVQGWILMAKWLLQNPEMMEQLPFPAWYPGNDSEIERGKWFTTPDPKNVYGLAEAVYKAMKAMEQGLAPVDTEAILYAGLVKPNQQAAMPHQETINREVSYYRLDPLYIGLGLFVASFVVLLLSSLIPIKSHARKIWSLITPRGFNLAWLIGFVGACILAYALIIRSLITMRSPVGNTYETIAFIACCGVVCALIAELISKKGLLLAAGLLLGAFACQMAIMYESSRATDHMDPLIAILRSNFLLSTHVITIVLGYAAGLLAAVVAHVYLVAKPLKLISKDTANQLSRVSYGILCFSLVFTLVGTVFGGIWGNESWGRFWGWDPKENGALMIVLWQLIILHAKKAKYIGKWGIQLANVIGGVIIAFAWWGVNMMGVGLHSYGFTSGKHALNTFYVIELVLLLIFIALKLRAKSHRA